MFFAPTATMTPKKIKTKRQNFDAWQAGAFGSKLRAWQSLGGWRSSGFVGKVALRELGKPGGLCKYNLKPFEVEQEAARWIATGVQSTKIMVNEMAPDEHIIMQGELLNDIFEYSKTKKPMRQALEEQRLVSKGLETRVMLRSVMTPSSYEDLQVLQSQYPDHVIELSIYSKCVGDLPGRNTLVWEVRIF